jgi:hypothetical protein
MVQVKIMAYAVEMSASMVVHRSCYVCVCQAIDVQLGLAIDSPKATLAVKRRLACEMVKCWQQVGFNSTVYTIR